ncbi:hypothetical protein ACWEPC_03285 [Nonomuraea sp. NPDC004297]
MKIAFFGDVHGCVVHALAGAVMLARREAVELDAYGMSSWRGITQGSRKLTELIERLQPRLHISGHYHHQNGPRHYGATTSYALAQLVPPKVRRRDSLPINPRQRIAPGSIGLLDTRTYAFEYIHSPWLADIHGDHLDLAALLTATPRDPRPPR